MLTWIWISKERRQRQQHLVNRESWRPVLFEDVDTNVAILRDL